MICVGICTGTDDCAWNCGGLTIDPIGVPGAIDGGAFEGAAWSRVR